MQQQLTQDEIAGIEREARKQYPISEGTTFQGWLQDGYIEAATTYALKAKVLVEALQEIKTMHWSTPDVYVEKAIDTATDALSEYNKPSNINQSLPSPGGNK